MAEGTEVEPARALVLDANIMIRGIFGVPPLHTVHGQHWTLWELNSRYFQGFLELAGLRRKSAEG